MHKSLFTGFIFCLLNLSAQSSIQINTLINPPYSPYLSAYATQPNKLMVTVTNTGRSPQSIRFGITLSGDNGVKISTDKNFRPGNPVILNPGQSRVFTAQNTELRDYFSANNLIFSGITKSELVQNEALPEGNYEVCVAAYDYNTGILLTDGAPVGCAQLPIYYIDPPLIIQPICNSELMPLTPQNILFSWAPPATAPGNIKYEFTLKEIPLNDPLSKTNKSNQLNPNDVIKNVAYPILYQTTLNSPSLIYTAAMPRLNTGSKYVWRVQVKSTNNFVSFKQNGFTEACVFEYASANFENTNNIKIKLRSPKNNETITRLESTSSLPERYEFSWEPLPNGKFAYETRIVKINDGQSPESAIKNNPLVIVDEKGAKYKPPYSLTYLLKPGKYAWQVIYNDLENTNNQPSSDIWSFTVPQPDTGSFKKFDICNQTIYITKLTNNDLQNLTGEGYYYFKMNNNEQGVKQTVYFKDLKLQHTALDAQGNKINFKCYKGTVSGEIKFVEKMLKPENGLEGEFEYHPTHINMTADLTPKYDPTKKVYTIEEGDKGEGCNTLLEGELTWYSDLVIKKGSSYGGIAIPISDDFGGIAVFKHSFKLKNNIANFEKPFVLYLNQPNGATLTYNKESSLMVIGDKVRGTFYGEVSIPSGKNINVFGASLPIMLEYTFGYHTGMLYKLQPKASMVKDLFWDKKGNVFTNMQQTESWFKVGEQDPYGINVNGKGLVIIPTIQVKTIGKEFKITLPYLMNKGKGFSINKTQPFEGVSLFKFKSVTKICKIKITESKLSELKLDGEIEVPFVNLKGPFSIYANYDETPQGYINFDMNSKSVVVDNGTQKIITSPVIANLSNDQEVIYTGVFDFMQSGNNANAQKFTVKNLYLEDIIINANGQVSMKSFPKNLITQYTSNYNDFILKLSKYRIFNDNGKNTFRFWGDIVMEENTLAPQEQLQLDFSFNEMPYQPFQMDPSTTASVAPAIGVDGADVQVVSNGVKVSYCNSSLCFDATFKYLNDAVYGKGFSAEGKADIKEPYQGKINTKFMCGKAPGGYSYWFVEAAQKDLITFPIGIADLEVYGFGGRLYYHMYHAGGDKNIQHSNYIPNKDVGYGVYGLLNIKNKSNNGETLWGSASVEITTLSSGGLMPIKLYAEAYILADKLESKTAQITGIADLTLNVSGPRYISGIVTADANVRNFIKGNGTLSFQMGDGLWYMHLGTPTAPVTVTVESLGKTLSGYAMIDKVGNNIVLGTGASGELFGFHSKKKKCLAFCCFSAGADVSLSGSIGASMSLPSFQLNGNVSLHASASVSASACGIGMSPGVNATFNGAFMVPNPFCIAGGLTLHTPSPLPDFNIKVRYKDGSISGSDNCN